MAELEVKIADLLGNELGLITDFGSLECEVPINDSRTGKLTISMYDPDAKWIRPLDRVIKVYYGKNPLCFGRILNPQFDFETGLIEVDFHDPTIVLKHAYHRYGDYVVDFGYSVDGRGAFWIVESSIPLDDQLDRGVIGNGIDFGENRTDNQGPQPPADDPGIWGRCMRGENVWDSLQKLSQKAIGPDFEFVPVDGLDEGYFVQMNVGAKPDDPDGGDPLGEDKTADVNWIHGINCNVKWSPDGNSVRNYYVAVNPGGERGRNDTAKNKALSHNEASWKQYGIFTGWESVGEKLDQRLLQADADQWVKSYAYPPNFFTVTPYQDQPGVPQFIRDFEVGDFVSAKARKAGFVFEESGQITKVTITQSPDEGSRQGIATVEIAPLTATSLDSGDPGATE